MELPVLGLMVLLVQPWARHTKTIQIFIMEPYTILAIIKVKCIYIELQRVNETIKKTYQNNVP